MSRRPRGAGGSGVPKASGGPEALTIVEIDALAFGGDAVGREAAGLHAGRAVFVPRGAPGDRLAVRLVRQKARVAWGEIEAIERAGPERVAAPCPIYARCGACQWQHVSRSAQVAAKRAVVERALGADVPIDAPVPDWGYRDRARLVVGEDGALGFRGRRSHDVVDVPACPLLSADLAAALPGVREAAAGLSAGDEVMLLAGAEGVAVSGALVRGPQAVNVAEPGSPALHVSAGAFAQVGRSGNAALVARVLEAVGPQPGRVLELFAGSGNLTRHLVTRAEKVWASDADAASVERGRANVPSAIWSAHPPLAELSIAPPGLVVLDPPRTGCDAAGLAAARLATRRIVYVSCDPQTLARDAALLGASGFALTRAHALDLMPQTFHVEVVATFDRAPRNGRDHL